MIKHIVMFKLKESAEGSDKAGNIQRLKAKLEALPGKIDEIKFFEVGIAAGTEDLYSDHEKAPVLFRPLTSP